MQLSDHLNKFTLSKIAEPTAQKLQEVLGFQCQQQFSILQKGDWHFKCSLFQFLTSVANDAISIMNSIVALANIGILCSIS